MSATKRSRNSIIDDENEITPPEPQRLRSTVRNPVATKMADLWIPDNIKEMYSTAFIEETSIIAGAIGESDIPTNCGTPADIIDTIAVFAVDVTPCPAVRNGKQCDGARIHVIQGDDDNICFLCGSKLCIECDFVQCEARTHSALCNRIKNQMCGSCAQRCPKCGGKVSVFCTDHCDYGDCEERICVNCCRHHCAVCSTQNVCDKCVDSFPNKEVFVCQYCLTHN